MQWTRRAITAIIGLVILFANSGQNPPDETHPAIAANNHLIVFTSALDFDLLGYERGGIFIIRPDGTGLRQLTRTQTSNFEFSFQHGLNLPDDHPSFSPDGKKIIFTSNRDEGSDWDIYQMDVNGANIQRLANVTGMDSEPVFSPDGSKIVFTSNRSGNFDIWVMDADGSNPVRLTTSTADDLEPDWSPNGNLIAFTRVFGFDNKEIFVMDANGQNQRQLTSDEGEDHDANFSPDSSQLVLTSEQAGSLPFGDVFKIRVSNGSVLGNLTQDLFFGGGDPAWSPDGSKIAFFRSAGPLITFPQQLWVMNSNGTGHTRLDNEFDLGIINIHPNWGVMADSDGDGRPDYQENENTSVGQSDFLTIDAAGDQLGAAVALADYNHDGFLDLFAGIPGENISGLSDAGRATMVLGSPAGPLFLSALYLTMPSLLDAGTIGGARQANGHFGRTMVGCDFNGDGFRDIAIGAPGQNRVFINTQYNLPWQQLSGTGAFGSALAAGDFNRDGRCDLAVGAPQDTRSFTGAGSIRVYYGNATGVSTTPQIFDQGDLPLVADAGREEANDQFGFALAAGDLTGDFAAELVVGTPGEDISGVIDAGLIQLIPGKQGAQLQLGQAVARDARNLPSPHTGLQTGAQFGETLAIGDFNGDIFDIGDVVVGIPHQNVGATTDSGLVATFEGSLGSANLVAATAFAFTGAEAGGSSAANGQFGQTLASGDISGDSVADLAIAAPRQTLSGFSQAGQVYVIFGTKASSTSTCQFCTPVTPVFGLGGGGLVPANAQRVTQPQVGRSLAANDHFGASLLLPSANTLAIGDLDKDGQGDLLIGTPEEDVAGLANSGLVSVRYGIKVGESVLTPTGQASEAGEPVTFSLTWTHPERWRALETLHLRVRGNEGVAFWGLFNEASNTFSLFNPNSRSFTGAAAPGSNVVLETKTAAFNLAQSQVLGSGPDGPDVTLTFNIAFKEPAVGQIYQLELMATDDQGNSQGFDLAGLWAVGPFDRHLPLILKQGSQN